MALPLPVLPSGTLVFVGANIFIYGLLGESRQCADLLERCQKEEVAGVTTTEVVGEVCHRADGQRSNGLRPDQQTGSICTEIEA